MKASRTGLGFYYETMGAPKPYVLAIDDIARNITETWAKRNERARRRLHNALVHRKRP